MSLSTVLSHSLTFSIALPLSDQSVLLIHERICPSGRVRNLVFADFITSQQQKKVEQKCPHQFTYFLQEKSAKQTTFSRAILHAAFFMLNSVTSSTAMQYLLLKSSQKKNIVQNYFNYPPEPKIKFVLRLIQEKKQTNIICSPGFGFKEKNTSV